MRQRKKRGVKKAVRRTRKDPIRAAAEYGIDIPMLIANLKRTPAERIRRHQIALETFDTLHKANLVGSLYEMKDIGGGRKIRVHTVDSLIEAKKAMNRPR